MCPALGVSCDSKRDVILQSQVEIPPSDTAWYSGLMQVQTGTQDIIQRAFLDLMVGSGLAVIPFACKNLFHTAVRSRWWGRCKVRKYSVKPVARFKLTPDYSVYTEDKSLIQAIAKPLVHNTSGVLVFATKPGSGKTTAAREVVRRLQESKQISGAVYVDCEDVTQLMAESDLQSNPYLALRLKLLQAFGIPRDTTLEHNFSAFFLNPPRPWRPWWLPQFPWSESGSTRSLLVLDQFELFTAMCTDDQLRNMVKGMALDAAQSDAHQILINVGDSSLAGRMYEWNANQKITPLLDTVYLPTKEFVQSVAQSYRTHDRRLSDMSDKDFETWFGKCTTPGDVVRKRDQYVVAHVDDIHL